MPSSTFFSNLVERSRDAVHAFAGVKVVPTTSAEEVIPDSVFEGIIHSRWEAFGSSNVGISSFRRILFWIAIVLVLLLFAAITNPTESSFRSHLTELSLRRHLADLRTSDDNPSTEDDKSTPTHPTTNDKSDRSGTETPPIAPFRFANHVSISLRTPALIYRTCFFFSLCFTSKPGPPAFLSDPPILSIKSAKLGGGHHVAPPPEKSVVFFGILGHWVFLGEVPGIIEWIWKLFSQGRREKGKKKNTVADKPGVLEMRAIASKEETAPAGAARSNLALGPSLTASKLFLRSDSFTNLADHASSLLPAHLTALPHTNLSPDSRRPSIVNLVSSPPALADSPEVSSPVLTSLKADLAVAQATLNDLHAQLSTQEESMQDAHSHLQSSLDELRSRRKEDDAERQELKSRTKHLEEQKRQAEGARREAEKKLKAVEAVRDGLESKIAAALSEMAQLRDNMVNSEKNLRTVQEEGAKYVVETRDAVDKKKEELVHIEGTMGELDGKNEDLGKQVKEAEERLKEVIEIGENARRIAPEEEMMMMAAAYEAAANEGYLYGHQQPQHPNPWANQAAQYMAEAGMPYVDQNYSARPVNSTSGFGHFAKQGNSASHRDLTEAGKRLADVSGFEDFGPGAKGHGRAEEGYGHFGLSANGRSTTPPISDTESDIYPNDLGSPSGIMSSSFTANLLPQGLLGSLEGDVTPIDDGEGSPSPATLEEALRFEPPLDDRIAEHDSGSESGSEEDVWRSPLVDGQTDKEHKRLSGGVSRFHPSLTPPANSHQSSNASLPSFLPPAGSRRWFSGTGSSDNVNLYNFHPINGTTSNDSLSNLGPGYDSSPFAPSASEKKALKWGPLSKYRWAGNRGAAEVANNDPIDGPAPRNAFSSDLFRSVPGQVVARSSSVDLGSGNNWLSARHASGPAGMGNGSGGQNGDGSAKNGEVNFSAEDDREDGEEKAQDKKAAFRFFSLRKPSSNVWSSS